MNPKALEKALFFVILFFLPTQLGLHLWPQFSYLFSLKIDYLSPTIFFWDLLVLALIMVWAIQKPKVNRLAFNLLFIFLLSQIISLLPNFNIGTGLVRLEQYLIAGFFGLYISSHSLRNISKTIYFGISLSVVLECLIAISQVLTSSTLGFWMFGERTFNISTPAIAKFDFEGWEFLRPYATFPHPNVLGGFLTVILPILTLVKQKPKKLFWLSAFFVVLTNFLTVSRVSILAGIAEGFFLIKQRWLYLLVGLIIVLSPILFVRFFSLINFDVLSLDRREDQMGIAVDTFLKNPILGVGINNFIPYAAADLIAGPNRFLQPVHNIYLLELVETGIFGLLGFLLLIFYPITNLVKNNSKEANLLLLSWLMILFLGVFDHYILTLPQGYRVLFLVWGLSMSYRFS